MKWLIDSNDVHLPSKCYFRFIADDWIFGYQPISWHWSFSVPTNNNRKTRRFMEVYREYRKKPVPPMSKDKEICSVRELHDCLNFWKQFIVEKLIAIISITYLVTNLGWCARILTMTCWTNLKRWRRSIWFHEKVIMV